MNMYRTEMNHKQQQTINTNVIKNFGNLAYVFAPLYQWVRIYYLCLPNLYNPTEETKLKSDDRRSQKWPAKVLSSTTSLHKNGFGLENIQYKPALNVPSWPQEGLVYIDLELVTISQLPHKIWAQKGPNIPQKGPKISKTVEEII
jgi:hypothetical protein